MKAGKITHRSALIQSSDFEIIKTYDAELRGIVNYYSLGYNVSEFYAVKHNAMESAVKTIAAKHKSSATWVRRKYIQRQEGTKYLLIEVENPKNPTKPYQATLGKEAIRLNRKTIIVDEVGHFYMGRNELVRRLLANECELCQSTDNIRVHHVRKLADVKKRYKGRNDPPPWAKFMMKRSRKTVLVCHKCHVEIHAGRYDGPKVK